MAYSDKVIEHAENPRNVGTLNKDDDSVGTGLATGTGLLTTGTQVAAYVQGCR